jgi:hypothetical protein
VDFGVQHHQSETIGDKTSSATGFSLKSELQMIDVKTLKLQEYMNSYISEVEAKIEETQSAGGNVAMERSLNFFLTRECCVRDARLM